MTEWINSTIISNYSSGEKWKWNNKYWNQKTFLLMIYMEKMSNFTFAPPVKPLLIKTLIIYKNMISIYPDLIYSLKTWCAKFQWCIIWGLNFIKTVYELFDNPSYMMILFYYVMIICYYNQVMMFHRSVVNVVYCLLVCVSVDFSLI